MRHPRHLQQSQRNTSRYGFASIVVVLGAVLMLLVAAPAQARSNHSPEKKIVFVLDCSGSTLPLQAIFVRELSQTIKSLSANHKFTVICFSGFGVFELVPDNDDEGGERVLLQATDANQQAALDWLDLKSPGYTPGGPGGKFAEEAILRGLSYEPHALYVVSDGLTGGGPHFVGHQVDPKRLLDVVRRETRDAKQRTVIFSVHMAFPDPPMVAGEKPTMRRLAEETAGRYRFYSRRSLGLE